MMDFTQRGMDGGSSEATSQLSIGVLIPCWNEEVSVQRVVQQFKLVLPNATVYVYDNNSVDRTKELAAAAGAVVRHESRQGKGHVVRRMFADIDADVYVLVDGDGTYDAESAPAMIGLLLEQGLDMVNGARACVSTDAFPRGHRLGNVWLTEAVSFFFGHEFSDVLSGYRVLSRRFVKSFPALSKGFEIETELSVHALELRMPIAEVSTPYTERPPGSFSKLRTFRDGIRILQTIGILIKEERPMMFFGILGIALALGSLILAWPIITEFVETGLVPRFPTAILSTGMMVLAFLSFACGLVLDTVTLGRREMKRMSYLAIPNPMRSQAARVETASPYASQAGEKS